MKNLNVRKKMMSLALAGTIALTSVGLSGCAGGVVYDDIEDSYDVIDSQGEEITIDPQVLDVPGEDWKLVVEYALDEDASKKWTITDDKMLYMQIYTEGLPEDTKVYIDNIHTDTTIVSTKQTMNGITQDSMDDRIHNSLMYGFPISDDVNYYGINVIEGQNDTFIKGSFYGFNGYQNGTVEEKRYTEEDYLKAGVYANKISSAIDLLVQKGDNEPYAVCVASDVVVLACNQITTKYEDGTVTTKTYNRDGSYTTETTSSEKVKSK